MAYLPVGRPAECAGRAGGGAPNCCRMTATPQALADAPGWLAHRQGPHRRAGRRSSPTCTCNCARTLPPRAAAAILPYLRGRGLMDRCLCGVDERRSWPLVRPRGDCGGHSRSGPNPIVGLADSKKLSEKHRDCVSPSKSSEKALAWCIAEASVDEIDRRSTSSTPPCSPCSGRLPASSPVPDQGTGGWQPLPAASTCPCEAIVKGDALVPEISAAVDPRQDGADAQLLELDQKYPQYGLAGHKGLPDASPSGRVAGPRGLREFTARASGRCLT